MNKKRVGVVLCFMFVLILMLSFVSAGFFSDFWGKITGKAVDTTLRVAFWSGKVNQHTENGVWVTDPDGSSGAELGATESSRITYCKKFYGDGVTGASAYQIETIDFCTAGNAVCTYTSTRQTYECVSGDSDESSICVPKTCQSLGDYNCGRWNDGCEGTLDCGTCASNEDCVNGVCTIETSSWTEWLNRDGPGGSGDYETKSGFTGVCDTPTNIECRVRTTKVSYDQTGQVVTATPSAGCYCLNSKNPEGCLDYEVRFLCPDMVSSYCGDGTCNDDETCSYCPQDCGACATSAICEDSDVTLGYSDGKNYYVRGWYGDYSDFCSLNPGEENILLEYYCSYDASGNPIKNYTKYNCSTEGKICKEYACVGESTSRIAYWPGKVNQHFNVTKGVWMTDPDKISSPDIDKLAYCKKWYGFDIVFVKEYKLETITTWMAIGNKGGPYTFAKQSYECVQRSSLTLKENGVTCSSDYYCKSKSCGEILANERDTNPESVCHENPNKCVIDSSGIEVNEGKKSCLSSKVFRTCSADSNQEISWGAQITCASDESCFEGRGCLKHEFIFRLDDGHFPADKYVENVENPPELEDAMELSDSCVGVSFRINKMPPEESDLDDFVSEMEARGYYYYITAGSSDFVTFSGFPSYPGQSSFLLDTSKLCGYLKNEHAEGLYVHELMGQTMYLAGDNSREARRLFDWDSVEQVLACAKANKKKVIWSDFGSGGWSNIRYAINHDDEVRKIFETYGDVLVPLIADNTRTDEAWRKDLPGGLDFKDIKYVSDEYCNGERGGSIQDWHWEALTGSLDVPASDIERYIGISYDEGGKYSQFEDSNWDKNEPQNHGEFYMGIQRGKNYICGDSPCVSSDCDPGFTCESPTCIGSYDKKVNRYGDPFDWDANTYYFTCNFCDDAGKIGYAVNDLAWYEHTCVKKKFLGICFGVRWSRGKTYVANAYRAVSCEDLSASDCNSHSGCSWGSFSCV